MSDCVVGVSLQQLLLLLLKLMLKSHLRLPFYRNDVTSDVEAGIGVIAGNTVWSMPERLECEVLQKARYINTLTFTFFTF